MRKVKAEKTAIRIGYQNDNETTVICFPVRDIVDAVGAGGSWAVRFAPPGNTGAYPIGASHVQVVGDRVEWKITNAEVAVHGYGSVQLSYTMGNRVAMTRIWGVMINASLGSGPVPEGWESYLTDAEAFAERAEIGATLAEAHAEDADLSAQEADLSAQAAAQQASQALTVKLSEMQAEATTLPAGSDATAEYDADANTLRFGIPAGGGGGGDTTDAVKYTPQDLTDGQKAQARTNIDAASWTDVQAMGTRVGAVETALAGKQAALNTAQMQAVNSGATADKVTAWDAITSHTVEMVVTYEDNTTETFNVLVAVTE